MMKVCVRHWRFFSQLLGLPGIQENFLAHTSRHVSASKLCFMICWQAHHLQPCAVLLQTAWIGGVNVTVHSTVEAAIACIAAGAQKRLHEVWAQLETAKREAYARKQELAVTQVRYTLD